MYHYYYPCFLLKYFSLQPHQTKIWKKQKQKKQLPSSLLLTGGNVVSTIIGIYNYTFLVRTTKNSVTMDHHRSTSSPSRRLCCMNVNFLKPELLTASPGEKGRQDNV